LTQKLNGKDSRSTGNKGFYDLITYICLIPSCLCCKKKERKEERERGGGKDKQAGLRLIFLNFKKEQDSKDELSVERR
jgi:hypothetical protein